MYVSKYRYSNRFLYDLKKLEETFLKQVSDDGKIKRKHNILQDSQLTNIGENLSTNEIVKPFEETIVITVLEID